MSSDMAIPRMFNSNTPFIIVTGGSELSFLGKEEDDQVRDEDKDSLVQVIGPHLSRVMQHGTAKHLVPEDREDNTCVSIVAQAEREDFQEFSPTCTQCLYSPSPLLRKHWSLCEESAFVSDTEEEHFNMAAAKLPLHHLQRKQRRKSRRRRSQEDGEQPPIIRGLWVQEIDWLRSTDAAEKTASSADIIPPPPQFTDSASCRHGDSSGAGVCGCVRGQEDVSLSAETEDTASSEDLDSDCGSDLDQDSGSDLDQDSGSICTHESDSDSDEDTLAEARRSGLTFDLMRVSGFTSSSDSTGCVQSLLGNSDSIFTSNAGSGPMDAEDPGGVDSILDALRGKVTQTLKLLLPLFFRDLITQTLSEQRHNVHVNEGLVFHPRLQPRGSRYREGEEYCVLHHIQNGSYGDVFSVRDNRTGFECAAKKIPLSHFSSEEVNTWSSLDSPRVVELFGAVREGPSVVLFMDLKPACLAQLLKEMNSLPEDLALHYLHQTLGALEHLHHRRILHLDVKVDNVLLSADCRDTFLCDFGLSETLDDSGRSTKAFRGAAFPGTETHMAPEVARGDQLCVKADVWSSCCMLLHMLNGCRPWIRFYSHPLCLQIVNEPPPLWEVPSTCNNFTAEVFRAGLQKDPERRASAKELRRKTTKALRAVGGLRSWSVKTACETLHHGKNQTEDTCCPSSPRDKPSAAASAPTMHWVSPWRTTAVDCEDRDSEVETDSFSGDWDSQPKSLRDEKDWETGSDSEVDIYMGEEELAQEKWPKSDQDYEGDWEEEEDEWDSSMSTGHLHTLRGLFPLLQRGRHAEHNSWGSQPELEYLRDEVAKGTVIQTPSPEPRDDPPSCFSCSDTSQIDASEKDSDHSSDDLSSGVFSSCNSQGDGHLEWTVSANPPSSHCFEGVDIWIENVQGECLRIRERRRVKVGHVAIGISDQISGKAFTLETLDRKSVSFDQEIKESGLWLRCVPAPDSCRRWSWRVRDGKLELQE